jgi:hypothetical protein
MAEMLERLDLLVQAVKEAKSRANETEVVQKKLADKLFQFIHTGK